MDATRADSAEAAGDGFVVVLPHPALLLSSSCSLNEYSKRVCEIPRGSTRRAVHTGCTTGHSPAESRAAAAICIVQPGLPVAIMSGFNAARFRAFRAPSCAAVSGCIRL